jgi:hypothetical protein
MCSLLGALGAALLIVAAEVLAYNQFTHVGREGGVRRRCHDFARRRN